jgi:hypothetical protein
LGSALLSLSVLADSGIEHYRGSFQNRAMYIPLGGAALALAAGAFGAIDSRAGSHHVRDGVYGLSALTGAIGVGFHAYNILKRPGGPSWINLFYGAPVGAPLALLLAGLLGRGAERIRDDQASTILGRPAGEVLSAVSSAGLAGTAAEAGLLHFRGAFQNRCMILPVTIPPAAGLLLAATIVTPGNAIRRAAKVSLKLTALLGLAGVAFHAYGVSRNMGGWRNWSPKHSQRASAAGAPLFHGTGARGPRGSLIARKDKQSQSQ